jgi:dihydroorotate dehydrogenase (NAD+) catalytic subunit
MPAIDLTTSLGPLRLKNPVTAASGTFGYGSEYADFYDPSLLGAIFLKGLTLEERTGNRPQRLVETPAGLLNSIGLQNVGFDRFVSEKLPVLQNIATVVIANICGSTLDDYVELARRLAAIDRIDAVELNISCPNVRHGGMAFGCVPESTIQVTRAVREVYPRPLIVKLSPNVTDITATARAAESAGADALSVVNTFVGMAIDVHTRRPKLGNVTGGLSGPAIRPIAVRMVWECFKAVRIPIIGQGGICDWKDAAEFLLAGATAISVGTMNFVNPTAPLEIVNGLSAWLSDQGCRSASEIVGAMKAP